MVDYCYSGKVVAVTGGGGYIGSTLVDSLLGAGAKVLRVSRKVLDKRKGSPVIVGDLNSSELWEAVVSQADVIMHLAGNTSLYAAKNDEVMSVESTVLPAVRLLRAARELNRVPRVVFASTVTLYGAKPALPASELEPVSPETLYDLHKWCTEEHLHFAHRQGIVESVALRLANVYGPSSAVAAASDRGVLNHIIRTAIAGEAISVYGAGDYLRDYVYIQDVVNAFMLAGIAPGLCGCSFNIGSGVGVQLIDAFRRAALVVDRRLGVLVPVLHGEWPDAADPIEHRSFVADIRRFSNATGWCPRTDLDAGFLATVDHYLSDNASDRVNPNRNN